MSLCLRGILEAAVLFFTNAAGCFAGKDFRVCAKLNSRVETESYLETECDSSPFCPLTPNPTTTTTMTTTPPSPKSIISMMPVWDGWRLSARVVGHQRTSRSGAQPALLLWSPGQHACWPAPDSYLTATRPWPETRKRERERRRQREKTRLGSRTWIPPSPKTLEVVIFQKPLLSPSKTI